MSDIITTSNVKDVIISLRGENIILAVDVAKLYGVETKVINQAVKNNPEKFPEGFVFELTKEEKDEVGKLINIAKKMLEKGYSEEDIADILR